MLKISKRILLTGFAVVSVLILLYSCKHEPSLNADTPTICFQEQVYPLIKSNCAISGCHSASSHEEGPVLATYQDIRNNVEPYKPNKSKIYEAITGKPGAESTMPPSPREPLTQQQIDLISIWILQGAENNTCPEPPCDTTQVTYSGSIQPLLNTWCTGCHGGNNPQGGILLETYDQVAALANNGQLYGAISWAQGFVPMPYESTKLSDCSVATIRIWIEEGALNN